MTDPADFLRRHQEMVDIFEDAYRAHLANDGGEPAEAGLAAVLPLIFAAHESDLAGDCSEHLLEKLTLAWADDLKRSILDREGLARAFVRRIKKERAAAYLAGQRAGREAAAKVADDVALAADVAGGRALSEGEKDEYAARANAADDIATAIRSLT